MPFLFSSKQKISEMHCVESMLIAERLPDALCVSEMQRVHGIFSAKSDVFSYGVLVLEIVTGRRNTCTQGSGPSEDLLTYVRHI